MHFYHLFKMKKLLKNKFLNNKYLASSLLVLTAFVLFTSHNYLNLFPPYLRIFFSLLPVFSIIHLFFFILLFYFSVKYVFKFFLPFIVILILLSIFFFRIEALSLIIHLLIPMLIFKLVFKDFKFNSYNKTYYALITYSLSIAIIAIILLQIGYFNKIFQEFIKTTNNDFNEIIKNLQNKDNPASEIMNLQNMLSSIIYLMRNCYPAIIVYSCSIFYIFNFIFSAFFISKNIAKKPVFINIFFIKTPEHYIWIFLFACLLAFVSFYYKNPLFKFITRNLALISAFIYIVEGGLIFLYKLLISKMNIILKSLILFIGLYIFIILEMILFFPIILAGLGILDYWFDFRKTDQFKKNNIDTLV